jgi:hypothetical protein
MTIPPEQVPSRYADEVWTWSAANTELLDLKYHTERSCSRLRRETNADRPIFRRVRSTLPTEMELCEYCDPECGPPNIKNTNAKSIGRSLRHADDPWQVLEEYYD